MVKKIILTILLFNFSCSNAGVNDSMNTIEIPVKLKVKGRDYNKIFRKIDEKYYSLQTNQYGQRFAYFKCEVLDEAGSCFEKAIYVNWDTSKRDTVIFMNHVIVYNPINQSSYTEDGNAMTVFGSFHVNIQDTISIKAFLSDMSLQDSVFLILKP